MEHKTKKSEETKKRIISCAQKLFYKKGFEATSVREITEAAGCAKGTFYLYFETKVDLLLQILNDLYKSFDAVLSNELTNISEDPFTQIDNLLSKICLYMQEIDFDIRLIHTGEISDLIVQEYVGESYFNTLIKKISLFLTEGIKRGYFRRIDPVFYSRLIFSLAHNTLESAMIYNYPSDLLTVKNELSEIIRRILKK